MNLKYAWNEFKKGYSYFHRKKKSIGKPTINSVEPTNKCPMSCRMCPRTNLMTRELGDMDFELFKKIIDQAKGSTAYINLQMFGEPLIHKDIPKMVEYAKNNGINVFMSVNPQFLTKEKVDKLLDAGLTTLVCSMEGTNSKTYKHYRGKAANFKKAVEGINRIADEKIKRNVKKPFIWVRMINMKETAKEFDKFKEMWKDKEGINKIDMKDFSSFGGLEGIKDEAEEDQMLKKRRNPKYACFKPWNELNIYWDGKVVPCCLDYDGKYVLGNLNEESLEEIWNGEKMQELRRQHIENDFKKMNSAEDVLKNTARLPANFIHLISILLKMDLE